MKPDSKELLKVAASGPVGFGADGAQEISQQLTHLVKERHTPLESLDSVGCSPLMLAAASGCVDAVATLIELGANIAAESVDKIDALGYAVKNGRDLVTSYLLGQSVGEGAPQLNADQLPSLKRIHAAIELATEKEDEASLKVVCVCVCVCVGVGVGGGGDMCARVCALVVVVVVCVGGGYAHLPMYDSYAVWIKILDNIRISFIYTYTLCTFRPVADTGGDPEH